MMLRSSSPASLSLSFQLSPPPPPFSFSPSPPSFLLLPVSLPSPPLLRLPPFPPSPSPPFPFSPSLRFHNYDVASEKNLLRIMTVNNRCHYPELQFAPFVQLDGIFTFFLPSSLNENKFYNSNSKSVVGGVLHIGLPGK